MLEKLWRITSCDLGQSNDHAASCVFDQSRYEPEFLGPPDKRYYCKAIRQWRLGTSYTQIVEDLLSLRSSVLIVEYNGVGRPVVDMLRQRARQLNYPGRIFPVITAASNTKTKRQDGEGGQHWSVPKVELVSSAKLLADDGMLILPSHAQAPQLQTLLDEMRDFQVRISKHGNSQFEASRGKHDDLVISFCLACWYIRSIGYRQMAVSHGPAYNAEVDMWGRGTGTGLGRRQRTPW